MAKVSKKFDKGVILNPTTDAATLSGEIRVDSADNKLKAYLNGSERALVSENQSQTLTNKTIDVDNNTISNIEVDNLKAGVLDTDLSAVSGSHDTIPSAKAVKDYVDGQIDTIDQAAEIIYSNTTSGLTAINVQDAIDEVDQDVDDLNTLSGVAKNATTLGTFTGSTIPDNQNNKQALQALETAHEAHLNDTVDAHDASAISSVPSGNLAATDVQAALNELQSDIDTRATSSTLTTHTSASSGVHGVTGSVVGTTDSQTLTNKTLTSPNINDGDINLGTASNTSKIVVSKDTFANINALTKEEASVYYATDAKKLYYDDGTSLLEVGSGSGGGINYIDNPGFEVNATGYSAYADAAASSPADGTGGSPVTTITRSTSSPLRDTASGLWSKSAANRQGEGFSYAFSIDTADQGKMQEISYDYTVSANYVDGDMRMFIYDVTNAVLIEPSQRDILANSGQATYRGYFQAASNSTSYRVIWHVATTSALAYDLKIDNVKVGPVQVGNAGTFVSDYAQYTSPTTQGFGTISSDAIYWRRNGNALEMFGTFVAGTVTATQARLNYPNSLVPNQTQFAQTQIVGKWWRNNGSATTRKTGNLLADTNGYLRFGSDDYTTATAPNSSLNGDSVAATGNTIFFHITSIPIQGWSTGVSASEIPSSSLVTSKLARTANLTGVNVNSSQIKIALNTSIYDTTGSNDTTNNRWTAPESSYYSIDFAIYVNSTNVLNSAYSGFVNKNGATTVLYGSRLVPPVSNAFSLEGSTSLYLNKGDYLEVYFSGAGNNSINTLTIAGDSEGAATYLNVTKISNPAQIAPTEFVGCSYNSDSGQAVTSGNNLICEDRIYDSHNAMNTSTGVYTLPVSGKFRISSLAQTANVVAAVGNLFKIRCEHNGTVVKEGTSDICENTTSRAYGSQLYHEIDGIKGDTLEVVISETLPAVNLDAAARYNFIQISKIG